MRAFSVKVFSSCSGKTVFCIIRHKNKRDSKKHALCYIEQRPKLMTGWTFHKMQWALNGEGVLNFIAEDMKNHKPTDVQILLNENPYFEIQFDDFVEEQIGSRILAPACFAPNFDGYRAVFIKKLHELGVNVSPECTTSEIICLYDEIESGLHDEN